MDLESWFLVLAVPACCAARGIWYWLRFSSGAIERTRHIPAVDDVDGFSRSLTALDSSMSRIGERARAEKLQLATRKEQTVPS